MHVLTEYVSIHGRQLGTAVYLVTEKASQQSLSLVVISERCTQEQRSLMKATPGYFWYSTLRPAAAFNVPEVASLTGTWYMRLHQQRCNLTCRTATCR